MGVRSDEELRKAIERAAHEFQRSADELRSVADTLGGKHKAQRAWLEQMASRFEAQASALSVECVAPDPKIVRSILRVGSRIVGALAVAVAGNLLTDVVKSADFSSIQVQIEAVGGSLHALKLAALPAGIDALLDENGEVLTDENGEWLYTEEPAGDPVEVAEFLAGDEPMTPTGDDLLALLTPEQRRQVAEDWLAVEENAVEYAESGIDHDDLND